VTPITIRSNQSSARCGEKPRNTRDMVRETSRTADDWACLGLTQGTAGRVLGELTKSPASLGPSGAEFIHRSAEHHIRFASWKGLELRRSEGAVSGQVGRG
jgi:hypothetical protein